MKRLRDCRICNMQFKPSFQFQGHTCPVCARLPYSKRRLFQLNVKIKQLTVELAVLQEKRKKILERLERIGLSRAE